MIRSEQTGNPLTKWAAPATTSATTVYTATKDARPVLMGVHICNVTGTAASATLTVTRDATVYNILKSKTVAANDYLALNDLQIPLADGDIVKVTDGTGAALEFAVKILERLGGQGG